MSYLEAILLALLQAITEFLPISSSGHLVVAQHLLGGVGEAEILYDVLLHVATTAAVLAYFRADVVALLRGIWRPGTGGGAFAGCERRVVLLIALATIPTAVAGLLIERYLEEPATRPDVVGVLWIGTGVLLWIGRRRPADRGAGELRAADALWIGTVQGIAVLPGVSRSGSTILTGVLRGIDRTLAARFSLLISVPPILAAAGRRALEARGPVPPIGPLLAGMVVAAAAGYACIGLILWMVGRDRFHLFAFYLWPLGAAAILWYHLAG